MAEISYTKTPKPGEWWVSDSGLVAHVVGLTLDGEPAWQQKNSRQIWLDEIGFFLACFHYEPRCDSFDWVEPEQAEWSDMAAIQNMDLRRSETKCSAYSAARFQRIVLTAFPWVLAILKNRSRLFESRLWNQTILILFDSVEV